MLSHRAAAWPKVCWDIAPFWWFRGVSLLYPQSPSSREDIWSFSWIMGGPICNVSHLGNISTKQERRNGECWHVFSHVYLCCIWGWRWRKRRSAGALCWGHCQALFWLVKRRSWLDTCSFLSSVGSWTWQNQFKVSFHFSYFYLSALVVLYDAKLLPIYSLAYLSALPS